MVVEIHLVVFIGRFNNVNCVININYGLIYLIHSLIIQRNLKMIERGCDEKWQILFRFKCKQNLSNQEKIQFQNLLLLRINA